MSTDESSPPLDDPRAAQYARDKLLHSAVVIGDCVQERTSLLVLNLESRAVSGGSFFSLTREHLVIKVSPRADPGMFRPLTPCSVSFKLGARAHVFVTTVREFKAPNSEGARPKLVLNVPGEIAALECRHAFRVPVLPDSDLRVDVIEPGHIGAAKGVDMSVNGLQFEIELETARALSIDQRVKLKIAFGEHDHELHAVVRRRTRNRVGVMFVESRQSTKLLEDPALEQTVRSLEREWLRNRLTDAT